ncbi:hypothetical protein GCM10010441_41570 [Kitasatospora paracochleata]|uniref:Roadblock/LAMTOR2 domain-containing protein n=2 Tax=Kitasatospora paracochleata TaxID=58354 RepID=A0ABT1J4P7_9ACTN|nr:hypothetical protein [Kitasatospora paracochleata]MCP2312402.1 hypothetical protein [Kitasatospora paracochleata]
MNAVDRALKDAMAIEGALGAALVDLESGMALGTRSAVPGLDLALAAASHADIVRVTHRTLDATDLGTEVIESILTSLTTQYHLVRPLARTRGSRLFLSLVLDRNRANIAMAHHHLRRIEAGLDV